MDGWHGCCRYPFAGKRSSSKLSVQVTVFKQPYFSCTKSYIFPIGDAPCILDYILKCPSILIMQSEQPKNLKALFSGFYCLVLAYFVLSPTFRNRYDIRRYNGLSRARALRSGFRLRRLAMLDVRCKERVLVKGTCNDKISAFRPRNSACRPTWWIKSRNGCWIRVRVFEVVKGPFSGGP